jgi:hypothetical protein
MSSLTSKISHGLVLLTSEQSVLERVSKPGQAPSYLQNLLELSFPTGASPGFETTSMEQTATSIQEQGCGMRVCFRGEWYWLPLLRPQDIQW